MKILAFVDTHGSKKSLDIARKKADDTDIVLCAGDLTVFEENLDSYLSDLNKLGKPVLVIHGNHESEESMRKACSLFKNTVFMHKGIFELDNYLFIGYGGGGFTEINRDFESVSKKFLKAISELEKKLKKDNSNKKLKTVLIFHAPPHNTKVDYVRGSHAGSKSYRKFIDAVKPTLVICGHLHENAGVDHQVGQTVIVNPGPTGAVIEI